MYIIYISIIFFSVCTFQIFGSEHNSSNQESNKIGIIRVINPGVFDYQSEDFVIRMRAWGVSFPERGQVGYQEAINFTERMLLNTKPKIVVKKTSDSKNIKVVDLSFEAKFGSFSREAIAQGFGWHNEGETNRFGSFVIAQLKAKRENQGIWSMNLNASRDPVLTKPRPSFPGAYSTFPQNALPQINYWVTSLGKIHRPGCSFYERGRGTLTQTPRGQNCRICGGNKR